MENLTKLKARFPEVRVRHMLMRGASTRGPFLGAGPTSRKLLHDLTPSPTPPRPHFRTRPADPSTSTKREPTAAPDRRLTQADVNLVTTYATVLLAIAVLLDVVIDGDRTSEIRTAGG